MRPVKRPKKQALLHLPQSLRCLSRKNTAPLQSFAVGVRPICRFFCMNNEEFCATTFMHALLILTFLWSFTRNIFLLAHAITEGSDMSEYKPWKDGTVTPRQGSLQALKASRSNIMDPWPV